MNLNNCPLCGCIHYDKECPPAKLLNNMSLFELYYTEEEVEKIKAKFAQEIKEAMEKEFMHEAEAGKSKKSLVLNCTGIESYDWWQAFWKERGL